MRYKVFNSDHVEINIIEADISFISAYCQDLGYSFEEAPLPEYPESQSELTTNERILKLENENKLLKEQVSAQADQAEFYEDCIAEMAAIVYA